MFRDIINRIFAAKIFYMDILTQNIANRLCTAHLLNLVGVHASSVSVEKSNIFGIVQRLFVSSTQRWEDMKQHIQKNLKGTSQTKWCAKLEAVPSFNLKRSQKLAVSSILFLTFASSCIQLFGLSCSNHPRRTEFGLTQNTCKETCRINER